MRPIKPGDFETLAAYEHHKRVKPVVDALLDVHPSSTDATRCVRLERAVVTAGSAGVLMFAW